MEGVGASRGLIRIEREVFVVDVLDAVKGRTDVTVGGAWSRDEFEAEVEQSFLVVRERVSVSVGNQFRLEDGSVVAEGVFDEAGVGELSADKVPELREETTI